MAAAANLSPKNPLIVLGLVGLAAWALTRRAAAAPAGVRPAGVRSSGQDYATPTYIAGQIAGAITAITKGFAPAATEASRLGQANAVLNADNRALIRSTEGDYYGASSAEDDARDAYNRAQLRAADPGYYGAAAGWSAPAVSAVNPNISAATPITDAVPTGVVYDPSQDTLANPWLYLTP